MNARQIKTPGYFVDCLRQDSSQILGYVEGWSPCVASWNMACTYISVWWLPIFQACVQSKYDSQYVNEAVIVSAL